MVEITLWERKQQKEESCTYYKHPYVKPFRLSKAGKEI